MADFQDLFDDTEEEIRQRYFDVIDALFPFEEQRPSKRAGDLVYTLASMLGNEAHEQYLRLNSVLEQAFPQYATGVYLDSLAEAKGVTRLAATGSSGTVRFMGVDATNVPIDTIVSTATTSADEIPVSFSVSEAGDVAGLADPTTAPSIAERTANIRITQTADATLNQIQRLSITSASGGTFTLTVDDDLTGLSPNPQTTGTIAYNASAGTIQTALEALSNVAPGDILVTGTGPFDMEMAATFANENLLAIVANGASLTGGTSGNISGEAVYKYVYVTELNNTEPSRGYTLPSSAPSSLSVTGKRIEVEIPAIEWTAPVDELEIVEVRVYRSYMGVAEVAFSEYKYVGSLLTNPKQGGVVVDNVSDADFLLIDDASEAVGGVPVTNTTGLVDLPVSCEETGALTDVTSGTVSLLDSSIPGIEKISNPAAMEGGSDEESDEELRARFLRISQAAAGAGNVADYEAWASSIDGIYGVSVIPEHDGPGTVKVVISGEGNTTITDADKIEEVRQYIAGDIAIANPTTNTISAAPNTSGSMVAGDYEYAFTYVNIGGGETELSEAYAVTLTGPSDQFDLTVIPTGTTAVGPEGVVKRRVYRRFMDDPTPTWALLTEIEDADVTTTYSDTYEQSALPGLATPSGDALTARDAPTINTTSMFNGEAPIGAHVTIVTIDPVQVYLTATIIPESGYSIAGTSGTVNLTTTLNTNLTTYFEALVPGEDIKYKDIENVIHDTTGVADFRDVELYAPGYVGVTTNIVIDTSAVANFNDGAVVYTEAAS